MILYVCVCVQWVIQHPRAVVYSGCIGNDRYAQILEERIHEIGVKALYQRTDKEGTGTCAVLLTGRNRCVQVLSFNSRLYQPVLNTHIIYGY
jgi:sugar/nucleoside kinase (ribokinase family)